MPLPQLNWSKPVKAFASWSKGRSVQGLIRPDEQLKVVASGELFDKGKRWFSDVVVVLTARRLLIVEQTGFFVTSMGRIVLDKSLADVTVECGDPGGFRRTLDVVTSDVSLSVSFPLFGGGSGANSVFESMPLVNSG